MAAQSTWTPTRPARDGSSDRPAAPVRRPAGRGLLARGVPYLLILPALLATAALLAYPLVRNVIISFQDLGPFQLIQHTTEWTGFGNYSDQLSSSRVLAHHAAVAGLHRGQRRADHGLRHPGRRCCSTGCASGCG